MAVTKLINLSVTPPAFMIAPCKNEHGDGNQSELGRAIVHIQCNAHETAHAFRRNQTQDSRNRQGNSNGNVEADHHNENQQNK